MKRSAWAVYDDGVELELGEGRVLLGLVVVGEVAWIVREADGALGEEVSPEMAAQLAGEVGVTLAGSLCDKQPAH